MTRLTATTVLWYCLGLTSPLTRNCEWTRLVSDLPPLSVGLCIRTFQVVLGLASAGQRHGGKPHRDGKKQDYLLGFSTSGVDRWMRSFELAAEGKLTPHWQVRALDQSARKCAEADIGGRMIGAAEEGERRGQAKSRTSAGTVTGGRGGGCSRGSKRNADSESELSKLSDSQASDHDWRQLSLSFGGMGGEGREGVESREEPEGEGERRGQARRRSPERRSAAPPGADRSDGQGPPSGLV